MSDGPYHGCPVAERAYRSSYKAFADALDLDSLHDESEMLDDWNARCNASTLVEQSMSRARCNAKKHSLTIWKYAAGDDQRVLAETDAEVEALLTKWQGAVAAWADAKLPMDLQFEKTPPPMPADLAKYKPAGASAEASDELREYHAKETLKAATVRKQVQATLRRLDRGESVGDVARVLTKQLAGIQTPAAEDKPASMFRIVDAKELFTKSYKRDWLIRGMMTQHENGLFAGPKKALKTTIGEAAAIALASGLPFMGNPKWIIPRRFRVLFCSAESGDYTLAETCKRIATENGLSWNIGPHCGFTEDIPEDAGLQGWLFHSFMVPLLDNPEHVADLRRVLMEMGIEVCFLDPAYFMFGKDTDAKSIMSMGPRLRVLNELTEETGCTFFLIHHFRKSRVESDSPQLEDIAFAGFQEWARQWLMLDRENEFEPGSGHHELVLSWGGSAGHSGQASLIVEEGVTDGHGSERTWKVEVTDRAAKAKRKAEAKGKAAQAALDSATEAINAAFRSAGGKDMGMSDLARAAGMDPRNKAFIAALGAMIRSKRIEEVTVTKSNGQTYEGFRRNWKEGEEQAA